MLQTMSASENTSWQPQNGAGHGRSPGLAAGQGCLLFVEWHDGAAGG